MGHKLVLNGSAKSTTGTKGICAQKGTFFVNRFPSLGKFIDKIVGFRNNWAHLKSLNS